MIVVLAMAVGMVWIINPREPMFPVVASQRQLQFAGPASPGEDLGLVIPGDDREPGWRIYEAHLRKRVEDVISGNVVEKSLPTLALPMLQERLSDGTLPAATTRPIGVALSADNIRLNNALRARKRWDWYQKNLTEIFEKNAAQKKWAVPARAAVQVAVRRWSNDSITSSDAEQIVYREGKKAMDLGCDEPLMCLIWAAKCRGKLYY